MSDFFAMTEELEARVGHGILDGSVTVDQVYALYQHEGADFEHPRGGEAFYLHRPLLEHAPEMYEAFRACIEGGVPADLVMIANMEELADDIPIRAPVEFNVLRESASPAVEDDGVEIYRKFPNMPRLTQDELNAIRKAGEEVVNPAEWLRQFRYHRGEGGR